ncbi:MAG: hypothetical protein AAB582_03070 [Patescibacteria group bacterium]
MNLLAIAGGLLGTMLFVPLCMSLWNRSVEQNLATFALWGVLDGMAAYSTFTAGGNYLLPTLYTLGSVAVITCIVLRSRKIKWSWVETFCSFMVVVCVVTWMNWEHQQLVSIPYSAEQMVIILSTMALAIATLPVLTDAITKPATSAPLIYLGYTAANAISMMAGSSWAIEERFYAGTSTIATALVFLAASRRWQQRETALAN